MPVTFRKVDSNIHDYKDALKSLENKINEAPVFCVLPLAITACLSVGLFFCPDVIYDLTQVFLAMKG